VSDLQTHLEGFPAVIEIPVAWGEMDSFGHVNNIIYFRYFESGRLDYFEKIGYLDMVKTEGLGPILASTQCRFRFPLTYPDTISVGTKISDIQEDRFLMHYRIVSHTHKKIAAEGNGLIVSYDYNQNSKTPIPEKILEKIKNLET